MRERAWVIVVVESCAGCSCQQQPPEGPGALCGTATCNTFAPKHRVTLDPYFIDKLEVTNRQYRVCVEAGFCKEPRFAGSSAESKARYADAGFVEYPIFGIEWAESQRYCHWPGKAAADRGRGGARRPRHLGAGLPVGK